MNNVQKQEILQIIGDVLDNLNHVTDENQLKEKLLNSIGKSKLTPSSTTTLNNLNPNIEILPRSGKQSEMNNNANDQVEILEEIEFGDNNAKIRVFKFSDSFKQNLEKEMAEIKSRNADLERRKTASILKKQENLEKRSPWMIPSTHR